MHKLTLQRNDFADLLRIIAAILVTVSHAITLICVPQYPGAPFWFYRLSGLGKPAVMIFLAVSGYSIMSEYIYKTEDFKLSKFLLKRITRLYIVLIPALLVTGFLDAVGIVSYGLSYSAEGNEKLAIVGQLNARNLLGTILFTQTFLTDCFGSNSALWSLSVEFWLYILFSIMIVGIEKSKYFLILFVFLFCLLQRTYSDFLLLSLPWLAGALAVYLNKTKNTCIKKTLLTIFALLFLKILWSGYDFMSQWIYYVVLGIITAISLGLNNYNLPPKAICRSDMTFSLFALHYPLLVFFAKAIGGPALKPNVTTYLIIASIISFICLFSFCFSRFTEVKTSKVRKWLNAKKIFY